MGGHIRTDKDLPEDARTLALADAILDEFVRLSVGNALPKTREEWCNAVGWLFRCAALGAVVKLWVHADTHVHENDMLDVTLEQLSSVTLIPVWLLRRYSEKWLRVTPEGLVQLPDYINKNALISREIRRQQSRERVKRWRLKHRTKGNALRKKKRNARNGVSGNARNANVTHPRAGARARVTGTGTETTETGNGTDPGAATLAAGRGAAATPRKSFEEDFTTRFGKAPAAVAKKVPT